MIDNESILKYNDWRQGRTGPKSPAGLYRQSFDGRRGTARPIKDGSGAGPAPLPADPAEAGGGMGQMNERFAA